MSSRINWSRVRKGFLCVCLVSLCTFYACAQASNLEQRNYSISVGLPHKHISTMLHHSDGFMYVGTRNGLCRFDGYEFVPIPLPKRPQFSEGLVGPWVARLAELKDGNILMSYLKYDGNSEYTDYVFDPVDWSELSVDSNIRNTDQMKTTMNSINLKGDTLVMIDQSYNRIDVHKQDGKVQGVLYNKKGLKLDISEAFNQATEILPVFGRDFTKCFFYSTFNGLVKAKPKISKFKNYLHNTNNTYDFGSRCRALLPLSEKDIIVSTEVDQLKLLNVVTGEHKSIEINKIDTAAILQTKFIQGFVSQTQDSIWALSFFDGLLLVNMANLTGRHVFQQPFFRTHHMVQSQDGSLIISGQAEKGRFLVVRYNPALPDSKEIIYEETTKRKAVANSFLLPHGDHFIWIGHSNGLYLFDLNLNKITSTYRYKREETRQHVNDSSTHYVLSGKSVLVLHENDDNQLLIGLDEGGLNLLNLENNTIQIINTSDGLSNGTVAGILSDETGYWLSTYHGLCHLDSTTDQVRSFYTNSGLPHDEFNRFSFAKGFNDVYYFGGMNGLTGFVPEELLDNNEAVRINLCEVNYYNAGEKRNIVKFSNFTTKPTFSIPATKRSCSFSFMLDDFTDSDVNTFSYQLIQRNNWFGVDESDWVQNQTNRKIQFDFLPAGTYDLSVRGMTSTGVQSDTFKIVLIVHDYFYKAWWFFLLLGSFVIGLIYSFYRMRLAQLVRIEKIRTKLSSDLHDDVGGLLSGIAYQMELLEYTVDEKRKPLVKQLAASSRKAMNQMRDVVWAIDARNSRCQDLVERISQYATDLLQPLGISFQLVFDETAKEVQVPSEARHNLLLICKEFLTNTVKHAEATKVTFRVSKTKLGLLFHLLDDGNGIPNGIRQSSGQGLKNMKMRTEKMKGTIEFHTADGFGISLYLPKLK